ncbi:acireductone dioxygenase (Ni2+-requiring) KNAG_0E03850 [Huiozyma naganishii CBS 8797]|uniref:Acireductone dioxygenase n=1 Tax=Huiozyma naganishii (strain ATCC MYA-139 / BCRC 22969 / CBS 8797 / KCTC 17520 / NBRC 10181 / NCYC 3082 / Yp74L-3) TaxID=1071383 RepID=J7S6X1_HUIN7|nr:hypothetical protein KNAG_0E03850 [Kazachstania naganishii CBS 8797]CCK70639.1 hypothetical protein KNAG_0E03850 [Kazachstania naganishii CBS 8797]
MVRIYIHDGRDEEDFRLPHDSGTPLTEGDLGKLGVFYKFCPTMPAVDELAAQRQYKNRDSVELSPESFHNDTEKMMQQLRIFYQEHLHDDEEIRYIVGGSGYFDLRHPKNEQWIRCEVHAGDLLVIPAGIYHRFTVTTDNYIKAVRLFKDEPRWEAHNKSAETDKSASRVQYLQTITGK